MSIKSTTKLLVMVATSAVAGCATSASGIVVHSASQVTPYSAGFVNYAAQSGEFAAELRGNPFPAPMPPEAIASSLKLPPFAIPAKVTTRPGPNAAANLRIVLVFNPAAPGPGTSEFCRDLDQIRVAPPGPLTRVAAAFCADQRAISWLAAEGPAADNPRDPRFRELMDAVMFNLLPSKDAASRSGDGRCFGSC